MALLTLSLALVPLPTAGQVLPGARSPERATIRAEFLDAVLKGVRLTTSAWAGAWASRDAEAISSLYLEEALLVSPEGDALRGRRDISAYFDDVLQHTAGIETFLSDMDASNNMAMTVERYVLTSAVAGTSPERGLLFTVYLNDGGSWRIRAQVFRPQGP